MKTSFIDISKIRNDFPILSRKISNSQLAYLDNAATTHKPNSVIDAICQYYMNYNSNIHRAVYQLAEESTFHYENTRDKVSKFINAKSSSEIIFTRNATEAINLVAFAWGKRNLKKGDIVVLSELEHHSNIVPWYMLSQEIGIEIRYIKIDESGYLNLESFENYISNDKVKLVSITNMSNVLGTIVPVDYITKRCHDREIPVMVDGAQSVPHMKVDVQETKCNFMAFSAHKMLGPTGIGVLYVNNDMYTEMDPFLGGGDMIKNVYKDKIIYNDPPYKYEAGTPNIADVIGFSKALDYLEEIDMSNVFQHELDLTKYALNRLYEHKDLKIFGPQELKSRGGIISFNIGDIHPHDLATIMNDKGICIRSGHHCAQILMDTLNVSATSRISFYIYNNREEIDKFVDVLQEARRLFRL